jgi:hypothetical protein
LVRVGGGEVRGVLVGGIEFFGGAPQRMAGVLQAAGQGVHRLVGIGQRREVVDAQPAGVVLVFERAGQLPQELGQHAGHGREGGDDLGGVAGFGQAIGGAGEVVEPADGVRGLFGQVADGDVLGVCAGHQNGGWSSLQRSSAVWRSRATRRPVMS